MPGVRHRRLDAPQLPIRRELGQPPRERVRHRDEDPVVHVQEQGASQIHPLEMRLGEETAESPDEVAEIRRDGVGRRLGALRRERGGRQGRRHRGEKRERHRRPRTSAGGVSARHLLTI